ncbi:Bug family tripartite tricarboxylate transporter substrate binding protein [Ottowia thiooxydans]|uniref:Bug family tripartite tricarboxylate transporter substrate binding protein n=1 Tax=Ottowia thiooxydans TaxID=219182 RepID=UPI0003FEE79F|nr:tripartite tricarboxylate transporter substrate binding protein [Ottowia thiooxydans]
MNESSFRCTRRQAIASGIGSSIALLTHASPAFAQQYPTKPVTVVVPFAAGGVVDRVARMIQQPLQTQLGKSLIIENRGGAGGTIGTAQVVKSAPDGYTLAMVYDSYATEQHVYPQLPYVTMRDLTGVSCMVRSALVLVVSANSPFKTLADYLAASKKENLSYSTVGVAAGSHLAFELLHQKAGTRATMINYKGGGPSMTDLMGGHVHASFSSLPQIMSHLQNGKLRALGVTSSQRLAALPDVPSISETFPGFEFYSWVGLVAPAKTPPVILDKLAQTVAAVFQDPQVRQQVQEAGFEIVASGRDEMNKLVATESNRLGKLIKQLNISGQS